MSKSGVNAEWHRHMNCGRCWRAGRSLHRYRTEKHCLAAVDRAGVWGPQGSLTHQTLGTRMLVAWHRSRAFTLRRAMSVHTERRRVRTSAGFSIRSGHTESWSEVGQERMGKQGAPCLLAAQPWYARLCPRDSQATPLCPLIPARSF